MRFVERPKSRQERPKSRQDGPKSAPRAAKTAPRGPRSGQEALKKPPGALLARFWSLRGSFSAVFGEIFEALLAACWRTSSPLASLFFLFVLFRWCWNLLALLWGLKQASKQKTHEALPAQTAEAAARSAVARLQSNVRARCLDALAASLVVVLVLLGASSSSPLAVFAAIFALLLRLPCLQLWLLSLACSACKLSSFARFPFLDSQVFSWR